jgi:hypothetical protein
MFEPPEKRLVEELDSLGENKVRQKLLRGEFRQFDPFADTTVLAWLADKDREAAILASSKRDAREERTLRFAMWANIIAIAAIIIATKEQIALAVSVVISWFL